MKSLGCAECSACSKNAMGDLMTSAVLPTTAPMRPMQIYGLVFLAGLLAGAYALHHFTRKHKR